jgi:hypothetical protein
MRRKYWPYIFLAIVLYGTVVWSAYQWGANQRLPDGSIFEHLANESRERALASATAESPLPPTADSRFRAAGPAFVAIRQGTDHVVFMVDQTSLVFGRHSGHPQRISVSATPAAELAGLRELWGATPEVFDSLPGIVKNTPVGQPWVLQLSPDSSIPVTIDRVVLADTGCSLSVGFLATVPPGQRAAFAATSEDYFVVRRLPVASAEPPQFPEQVSEEPTWQPSAAFERQMVRLLTDRMQRDLPQVDADLVDNQEHLAQREETWPLVRPAGTWLAEWKQLDRQLQDGQGQLNYDTRAFRLTPDGAPRLFVRARWRIADTTVFLMSAWFRADPAPVLLSADSGWSKQLRQGKLEYSFLDHGDFQSILNVFDADHDGWAELLIYRQSVASSAITLYRYNDFGLIPMKASLRQDLAARSSCLPGLQAQTEVE